MFDFEADAPETIALRENNPNYADEPYEYHAHLIELLALTTIGKEGMIFSESRLRGVLSLHYLFFLLSQSDDILQQQM